MIDHPGPDGDWADRPSFDAVTQAFTGVTAVQGGGPSHEPKLVDWGMGDELGAMNLYGSGLVQEVC